MNLRSSCFLLRLQLEEGGLLPDSFQADEKGNVFLRAKSNPSLIMYVLDLCAAYSSSRTTGCTERRFTERCLTFISS